MSPASYRAAPPRVGKPHLTGSRAPLAPPPPRRARRRKKCQSARPPGQREPLGRPRQTFGDEVLATAVLGRLPHHCDVISVNGSCYRLKNRPKAIERDTGVA
ncbi:ATP-binding protein [Streptomyces sp. NPDC054961]